MQQEPSFWDNFKDFFKSCFDSGKGWVYDCPGQAASVGVFSVGIGVVIGLLSANPIGILGGIFASISSLFGGSYLGVSGNNQAQRAHRFERELAVTQAGTVAGEARQAEINAQNSSMQTALTNNLATIDNLQQRNNNLSEQRGATAAAVITTSPSESPVAQTAPVTSLFSRGEIRQRRPVNSEPDPIVSTQNP